MAQPSAQTLLGQNVADLRETQGISRLSLAERLGWTIEKVSELEAGALDLDLDAIDQLAAALSASPRDLFLGETDTVAERRKA